MFAAPRCGYLPLFSSLSREVFSCALAKRLNRFKSAVPLIIVCIVSPVCSSSYVFLLYGCEICCHSRAWLPPVTDIRRSHSFLRYHSGWLQTLPLTTSSPPLSAPSSFYMYLPVLYHCSRFHCFPLCLLFVLLWRMTLLIDLVLTQFCHMVVAVQASVCVPAVVVLSGYRNVLDVPSHFLYLPCHVHHFCVYVEYVWLGTPVSELSRSFSP